MIGFGVLGLGNIAHRFCRSLVQNKDALLVGVASSSLEKQKQFQELYHPQLATDDYQTLIHHPEVDIIYIATRHLEHYRIAKACLLAGKGVLCEKPMTLNAKEAEELIKIAKEKNVFLMEALKSYFIPGLDALKEDVLKQQVIGDVLSLEASFNSLVPLIKGKYLFEKGQGGALNDVGIYPLSLALALIPKKVKKLDVQYRIHPQAPVDSFFEVTLDFETGQKALLYGAIDENREKVATIIGTKGKIIVPYYYRPTTYTIILENETITKEIPLEIDDMQGEIKEVIQCLKTHQIESAIYTHKKMLEMACLHDRIREKMVIDDD